MCQKQRICWSYDATCIMLNEVLTTQAKPVNRINSLLVLVSPGDLLIIMKKCDIGLCVHVSHQLVVHCRAASSRMDIGECRGWGRVRGQGRMSLKSLTKFYRSELEGLFCWSALK